MERRMNPRGDDKSLITESDVEQKFIYGLLTNPPPEGLGYSNFDFRTKGDIRKLVIDKSGKQKLYYPDYAVILNGLPCIIVEAKAPNEDIHEATRQARLYATEINASYPNKINPCERILVTDGTVIAACYWDSSAYEVEMLLSKFDVLDPQHEKLVKFLSKETVSARSEEIRSSIRTKAHYLKPVHMLGGKTVINEIIGENSFGANISVEYKYLFNPDSLDDRDSIIHNAYVESKRKQSHIAPIDRMIRAATPKHIVDARLIENTDKNNEIAKGLKKAKKLKNEICLLIGSVGSGKSTFSDYLRVKALPDDTRDSTVWLNINLNKAPLSRELIYNWVVSAAISIIKNSHSSVDFDHIDTLLEIYDRQINFVKKGRAALFAKDSPQYLEAIYKELEKSQADSNLTLESYIHYLFTTKNKLLVIALDNCDKRVREDQLLMFEVASWLKDSFACMVFLPLRDTTYDQFKDVPPLDTVIKDLVFRIDPPLLEKVIYARLHFALREISNQNNNFTYHVPNGMTVNCSRKEVGLYLQSIISSLFQDPLFKSIITGLAGRNIRKGLEILLDFCKSGHIDESEILKIRGSNGEYKLPSHLVAKTLLKGKRRYYNDEESYLKNMFASYQDDSLPDPFVRISILHWLRDRFPEYGPNRTRGFHRLGDMISSMQAQGHAEKRVFEEARLLVRSGCIYAEAETDELSLNDLICIAPSGVIHLDLLKNLNYLSSVSEDTLFRENQVPSQIKNNLMGQGRFKSDSRQTVISNSLLLMDYMTQYYEKFFLGNVKLLSKDSDVLSDCIREVTTYVHTASENDTHYSNAVGLESEYPPGTLVDSQIVAILPYGFIVEFGLNGKGLVHWKNYNGADRSRVDSIEVGDWVIVEIIDFNSQHKKFNLKLITV